MLAAIAALSGCGIAVRKDVRAGLPESLAIRRAGMIRNIRYHLTFDIRDKIQGRARIRFDLIHASENVVLDFKAPKKNILSVSVPYRYRAGHIVFKGQEGPNDIEITFLAPASSIHREKDYLYTLFVPDRASEAFPCFDQPDLKAQFTLLVKHPAGWSVISNTYPDVSSEIQTLFQETKPLPTYLFAFAAGKFYREEASLHGRTFRMFHLEEDREKIRRNAAAIFDLHSKSLAWLEDYTAKKYPFSKFDFVLIPGFPFSGMEHPGAVLYRADRLILDESATIDERLRRASVIAHETAHMWFGNLVTMRWFDDVWTKESFASFMADKIVRPMFPDIDFGLRFVTAHAQYAYAVDRSSGTNPLHQPLNNLKDAGELYGSIIYHKSPFVLRQLESLMGPRNFREGLRVYLRMFAYGNAMWRQLIGILDDFTPANLSDFSRAWVYKSGRPLIETHLSVREGRIESLELTQTGGTWNQTIELVVGPSKKIRVRIDSNRVQVAEAKGLAVPAFVFANGDGSGYGRFRLDERSRSYVLKNFASIKSALTRAALWESLFDGVLEGEVPPAEFTAAAALSLLTEPNELIVESLIGRGGKLVAVFWNFLSPEERSRLGPEIEKSLVTRLSGPRSSMRTLIAKNYRRLANSAEGVKRLEYYWHKETEPISILHFDFSERDLTETALILAVHDRLKTKNLLDQQARNIQDPELKRRFKFLRPAVSSDPTVRARFFVSLQSPANRRKEPWVIDALKLLHHPIRRQDSERFILPSLKMMKEIRDTGDIFFPAQWAWATLGSHNSESARRTVESFLQKRKKYPARLRLKILQAADSLFRSSHILQHKP